MLKKFDRYTRGEGFAGHSQAAFEAWRDQAIHTLREHDLLDMEKMEKHTAAASEKANAAFRQVQQIEERIKKIRQQRPHIIQYSKTRKVYA